MTVVPGCCCTPLGVTLSHRGPGGHEPSYDAHSSGCASPTDPERFVSPRASVPTWKTRFAGGLPVTDR